MAPPKRRAGCCSPVQVGAGNGKKATQPLSELCLQSKHDLESICFTWSRLGEEAEGDDGEALPRHPPSAINVPPPLEKAELKEDTATVFQICVRESWLLEIL